MNVYVLPNSKAAFRKKQATSKKRFLCLSDYVKEKRTTCSLLPAGKGCVWIEQFFCSKGTVKMFGFLIELSFVACVLCSPGTQNWSKWVLKMDQILCRHFPNRMQLKLDPNPKIDAKRCDLNYEYIKIQVLFQQPVQLKKYFSRSKTRITIVPRFRIANIVSVWSSKKKYNEDIK